MSAKAPTTVTTAVKARPVTAAKAKAIAGDAEAVSGGYGFDPTIIIAIIMAIIEMLAACKKSPEDAAREARRPGRLARAAVKRECRKAVGDRDRADLLAEAVLSHAETFTVADVSDMMAEAKG